MVCVWDRDVQMCLYYACMWIFIHVQAYEYRHIHGLVCVEIALRLCAVKTVHLAGDRTLCDLCCVYTKLPGTSAIRDSSAVPLPHVCNIAKTTEQISTPHDLLQWFIFEIIIQLHYFALPFPHSKPTVHKHLSAFIQTNSLFFINSYCIYIYILKTINMTRSVFIMICVSMFPSLW